MKLNYGTNQIKLQKTSLYNVYIRLRVNNLMMTHFKQKAWTILSVIRFVCEGQ